MKFSILRSTFFAGLIFAAIPAFAEELKLGIQVYPLKQGDNRLELEYKEKLLKVTSVENLLGTYQPVPGGKSGMLLIEVSVPQSSQKLPALVVETQEDPPTRNLIISSVKVVWAEEASALQEKQTASRGPIFTNQSSGSYQSFSINMSGNQIWMNGKLISDGDINDRSKDIGLIITYPYETKRARQTTVKRATATTFNW